MFYKNWADDKFRFTALETSGKNKFFKLLEEIAKLKIY